MTVNTPGVVVTIGEKVKNEVAVVPPFNWIFVGLSDEVGPPEGTARESDREPEKPPILVRVIVDPNEVPAWPVTEEGLGETEKSLVTTTVRVTVCCRLPEVPLT